jgi:hypothetical protein
MSNCEKKIVKLYSSINFSNPVDEKSFGKWDIDSKLKSLIHFVGEYVSENQPNIYFKAKVSLNATVNDENGDVTKSNVVVKDICFKNEFNVSDSSLTDEYKYLYDISCSSADNASSSSSSSSSSCSSELSLSEIYANSIEKQIMINVKSFIESDAFKITWVLEEGYYILDTTQYNSGSTFPNIKMSIKSKLTGTSSCSSISSSDRPVHFVKTLIMGLVALIIVMFLLKCFKNNGGLFGGIKKLVSKGVNLIKSILPQKHECEKPQPEYEEPQEH